METAPLKLAFIWHMHQPDYRDSSGVMTMPWVFLHAIKDYYEMPWLLTHFPGLKATFNVTPPLIEQLNLYRDPLTNDAFLAQWIKPVEKLEENERAWMVKMCKSTQFETMVRPLPRYAALFHRDDYSPEQLLELQVLFMLAWCGNYLRHNSSVVKKLLAQRDVYSQRDKHALLEELTAFVATILPFYAKLQKAGRIAVSTTPYNHPILPLLLDMENAKRANPHTTLPANPLSLESDASEQVSRAVALYKKTFGTAPVGFWPAEGAVDERSVGIYRKHGLKWIATDEEILFRSLKNDTRDNLYSPYRFDGVTIGFRDHGLSDLIGFTYRFKPADEAADHFVRSLGGIGAKRHGGTVFVILDGENAWEFFESNAYDFFMALYARLERTGGVETVTMNEVADQPDQPTLSRLAPGSWIYGNFDTWSGHAKKNRAWELIYQTRRDADHHAGRADPETAEKVRFHFLAAECSDWFWWYGDDHATDFAEEFDALFRDHLIAIYRLLEMQPPADLFEPIISQKGRDAFLTYPQSSVSPIIDGKESSFFEWLGSGMVDEHKGYSTMDRVRGPVEKIHYGHDEERVYLAFEGDTDRLREKGYTLIITVEENGRKVVLSMTKPLQDERVEFAFDERPELALSRQGFIGLDVFHLRFEIARGEEIVQTLPGYGSLHIDMNETYAEHWFV
ncbi:MAG: glycoside hydrolase [Campylobacterales bacterium]|nr:glycoside hydrolase [Campylobacterales bacterium]